MSLLRKFQVSDPIKTDISDTSQNIKDVEKLIFKGVNLIDNGDGTVDVSLPNKPSCRAATDGTNLALDGTDSDTIDGVTLVAGDRLLVKDQTTASENGIYVVDSVTSSQITVSRAEDADASDDVNAGMMVPVSEGTSNSDSIFKLTTNDPITLGSTGLSFSTVSNSSSGSSVENHFFNSPYYAISDSDYEVIGTLRIASGNSLDVKKVGVFNDLQNIPTGLKIVIQDVTNNIQKLSENTKLKKGSSLVTLSGAADFEVRIKNDTGSTQISSAFASIN